MSVVFTDNTKAVLAKFQEAKIKALTALGQTGVELTTNYMENKYGRPIRISGDLIRSMSYNVRGDEQLKIGSNKEYAPWVHDGTKFMIGRPFLRDALLENIDVLEEVAGLKLSISK